MRRRSIVASLSRQRATIDHDLDHAHELVDEDEDADEAVLEDEVDDEAALKVRPEQPLPTAEASALDASNDVVELDPSKHRLKNCSSSSASATDILSV